MNAQEEKKVVMELFVASRPKDGSWVETLIPGAGLTVSLRRARVTSRDAWLQFDVSGPPDAVDAFVRGRKDELTVVTPVIDKVA